MKAAPSKPWSEFMVESLSDPAYAEEYLNVALEEFHQDRDRRPLLRTLGYMAKSQGGLTILAAKTGLNRESLYKTFSGNSNPRFETIEAILHALGFRLTVERLPQSTE